jgi:hypothetical protein
VEKLFVLSGNKMLSIEFLMLLILLLVIKTINASTLPASVLNDLAVDKTNKCQQISITQHCPELKYNQTMHGHHLDIDEANEMVRGFYIIKVFPPP